MGVFCHFEIFFLINNIWHLLFYECFCVSPRKHDCKEFAIESHNNTDCCSLCCCCAACRMVEKRLCMRRGKLLNIFTGLPSAKENSRHEPYEIMFGSMT